MKYLNRKCAHYSCKHMKPKRGVYCKKHVNSTTRFFEQEYNYRLDNSINTAGSRLMELIKQDNWKGADIPVPKFGGFSEPAQ